MRGTVGVAVGSPCLIEKEDDKFMVEVIYWKKHYYKGLRMADDLDMNQDVIPKIS